MLLRIHHAQITIPPGCEEKARDFYCRLLGLSEITKPASLRSRGGFWLELGGLELHIGVEENQHRGKTKAHLAYMVKDLDDWRRRLEGENIEVINGIRLPETNRFEFRDPFGNRVEFLEKE